MGIQFDWNVFEARENEEEPSFELDPDLSHSRCLENDADLGMGFELATLPHLAETGVLVNAQDEPELPLVNLPSPPPVIESISDILESNKENEDPKNLLGPKIKR